MAIMGCFGGNMLLRRLNERENMEEACAICVCKELQNNKNVHI